MIKIILTYMNNNYKQYSHFYNNLNTKREHNILKIYLILKIKTL